MSQEVIKREKFNDPMVQLQPLHPHILPGFKIFVKSLPLPSQFKKGRNDLFKAFVIVMLSLLTCLISTFGGWSSSSPWAFSVEGAGWVLEGIGGAENIPPLPRM